MQGLLRKAGENPQTVFRAFKYTIYLLLLWNVVLFFQEDLAASAQTFRGDISWRNAVEAFSAAVDTAAWLVLLLLFELETAVIDDDRLRGNLKWILHGLRTVCYFLIIYAFYGYCSKYLLISQFVTFQATDLCALAGSGFTWLEYLDEYRSLDESSCLALGDAALYRIENTSIIGTLPAIQDALKLAAVDVVNAADWLLIVALLEVEVYLQLRDRLTDQLIRVGRWLKIFLYGILFVAAGYWGLEGDFLDFWDAFLWLVAFIFIELNIFRWHEETTQQEDDTGPSLEA